MDFLIPNLTSPITVGLLAIITVSYCLISRSWRASKGKTAPEAKGAWPLFGHLPLLGRSAKPLHTALGAMADKYGPLFTVRLGVHQSLVVSSSEMAKECFTINDMCLSSRPKMAVADHIGYNYAMFGFAPYGPYWREMRKITTLELLSIRRLELLKHIRVSEVTTFLKEMYKTWSSRANVNKGPDSDQVLVELKQWFGDLSLNVILRMVAGKRYSVAINEEEKNEARQVQKAVKEFFDFIGLFLVGDVIPYLQWLDLGGHVKAMKKTGKKLDAIVGKWVEEHKQKRALEGNAAHNCKGEQDFIDTMISILEGADLGGFDADTVNKATTLNMIAGGSDTTMVTLTWAIALLLNNRDKLKRAQDELDTEIGRERFVSESDMSKLVYIQAIVKETLRLYPAAPLSAPHEFNKDCTIGGYFVPKGTRLITNLWKIQTDPKMWPDDPLGFKPERFLTTHKDVDVKGQHFELIPFGSGRRACPGLAFGIQMVQFTLASFLHAFQVSNLPDNAPIDMTESLGITNVKATPLEVLIKPRLSHKLYE
ncbi:putative cytochrome P450 [Rosa chinensis]|uniref:Putative cytochrome P450 n=1 Tax=Rosa chinensis TaxID=74649 RepID=A0A2P6QHA6_ROSCH|nr:cytochrome P450 CYP82D47 [Rosa chinensis]PRQ33558.1 putative cytochrome P450 [Rosa chinensis]